MVSNTFAKSLGYGGSKPIKSKSISTGGGHFSEPDHSGDQNDAKVSMPTQRRGFQEKGVSASGVNQRPTTRDPQQKGGKR